MKRISKRTFITLAVCIGVLVVAGWYLSIPTMLETAGDAPAQAATRQSIANAYGRLPLTFEPNRGQSDGRVKFISRGSGHTMFFTETETVFSLAGNSHRTSNPSQATQEPSETTDATVSMRLIGANPSPAVEGVEELAGKSNYFLGSNPAAWETNIPHFARVRYSAVYPGVDLVFYGSQRQMEYDFVVAPGADPQQIRFRMTGADALELDETGDLVITVAGREMRQRRPIIYQGEGRERTEVAGEYRLIADNEIGFALGPHDPGRPLVIDPVLVFSTFLGGSGSESFGSAIFVEDNGSIYVSGPTNSPDFPTLNALQPQKGSGTNAFVAKLSPDGQQLVYATYLGGTSNDSRSIAADHMGNVYITGRTNSGDFPTTQGAFQPVFGGGAADGFLAKISPDGATLLYSTFLGGSGTDNGNYLAVDRHGDVVVAGATNSSNFPTQAAMQSQLGGAFDAFIAKLTRDGELVYSSYWGGSAEDRGNLISVDAQGNAFISGRTASTNFPILNALQTVYGGGIFDAYFAKFDPQGQILLSTYWGGSNADAGAQTSHDPAGNIYFTGTTNSVDFPTFHALQPTLGGGMCGTPPRACYDAFVTKFRRDGNELVYSTYLGGTGDENGIDAIGVVSADAVGSAYVGGRTGSGNFPSVNPVQQTYGGGPFDNFVAKLNRNGSALVYSTYLGGSGDDTLYDLKVRHIGNVYFAGYTASQNYPTLNPLQPTYGGGTVDAYVSQISEVPANGHFYFAQAGGGNGFSTEIVLTNPSADKSVRGTMAFFGPSGRPQHGDDSVVRFEIQPAGNVTISTSPEGSIRSGYVQISSDDPVFANSTFIAPGLPSLPIGPSVIGSRFQASVSHDGANGIDAGIALVNVSDSAARVKLSLLDSSGYELLGSTAVLEPGAQLSRRLSELIPNVPNRFVGTLQIHVLGNPSQSPAIAATVVEFGQGSLLREIPIATVP